MPNIAGVLSALHWSLIEERILQDPKQYSVADIDRHFLASGSDIYSFKGSIGYIAFGVGVVGTAMCACRWSVLSPQASLITIIVGLLLYFIIPRLFVKQWRINPTVKCLPYLSDEAKRILFMRAIYSQDAALIKGVCPQISGLPFTSSGSGESKEKAILQLLEAAAPSLVLQLAFFWFGDRAITELNTNLPQTMVYTKEELGRAYCKHFNLDSEGELIKF
jgi:hypothetical protein